MARRLTTSNLIAEVRSILDESNEEALDSTRDIIPALNRAQDFCANILARSYKPPLLAYKSISLTAGEPEIDVPEEAFEQRVVMIEVNVSGFYVPVEEVSFRDASCLESSTQSAFPTAYSQVGHKIRLYPAPSAIYPLRIWYVKDPDPMVLEQGTVTSVNSESNYVLVSDMPTGDALTLATDVTSFNSYVNFINGQTGEIRGTCQIQTIGTTQSNSTRITFRSTPTRTEVLGRTVSGTLPEDLEADDLICTVDGTCIAVLKKPVSNYMVQHAASELGSVKFGYESTVQDDIRKELEKQVERSWVGRPQTLRVKLKSSAWDTSFLRTPLNRR